MNIDDQPTKLTRVDLFAIAVMVQRIAVFVFNQNDGKREQKLIDAVDAACIELDLYENIGEPLQ